MLPNANGLRFGATYYRTYVDIRWNC